jgi:carboxypeptidase family protein
MHMLRASAGSFTSIVAIVLVASTGAQGPVIHADAGTPGPSAQQPARPATDVVPPPAGTATVRGHVVAADTGQPLRKTQVRLTSTDAGPGGPRENRLATTDADGTFEFTNLSGGRYMLTASKGSYVSLSYGQSRPDDPMKPLPVGNGQTVERVDFSLPRGGILTGRVVDEYGEPMSNLQVAAVSWQTFNGQRRLVPSGRFGSTDDLGEFRLFGVPPGQYLIEATWRSLNPVAVPGVPGARADDRTGYAPTLFPGVTDANRAQRFTIGAGDTISDLTFAMLPIKTTNVSGTVANSQGRPMQGMLMVVPESGGGYNSTGASIRPDGSFTIAGLAPGDYTLRAQPPGGFGPNAEIATTKITANGEDITDLRLVAAKPSLMSGRVVIDPSATASAPPIMLTATPVDGIMMPMGGPPARVNDDGTFELSVRPGRTRIGLMNVGMGWVIRAVRLAGTDVIDSGVDVEPNENITRLEVELTNRITTVSGLVTNARGEPAKSYSVIVFSQDRERWTGSSRYQGGGRPDQDGRFKVTGLPQGSYYIVALERIEPGQAQDPDFLERVVPKATAFALNEGETRVVDLRLTLASDP